MEDILYSKPDPSELLHSGVAHDENPPGRGSGRYKYGSGPNAYQRAGDFLGLYNKYKAQGLSEKEIAEAMGYSSTTTLRRKHSSETQRQKMHDRTEAQRLRAEGKTLQEIADILGAKNESTVRGWLAQSTEIKKTKIDNTADVLKDNLKKHLYLDVGKGVEYSLNVTKTTLDTAVDSLKDEGYQVFTLKIKQYDNPGQTTNVKILAPPRDDIDSKEYIKEIYKNTDKIGTVSEYSPDGGLTMWKPEFPQSISSKRVYVRYAEEGGADKDGSIEIRRGVEDLSLQDKTYAQVRIALDGKYYLKGVALYSNNIPDGYDIVVNSNKKQGTPIYDEETKKGWAKKMETNKDGSINEEMPFGALIKANGQYRYGKNNEKLGAINLIREEDDWNKWSKTLAAQFLSKQSPSLIKRQLNETFKDKVDEYNEIMSLTNPSVKKKLLEEFAESCDTAAVNLKAKALPGQMTKLLVPIPEMKDNEVYAPSYANGTRVCLVRYPHGGTFEIPELVVNNKVKAAKDALGTNPKDAIGINSKVAERLSGADFDGDTVICIPTKTGNGVNIRTSDPLPGLVGFDPKEAYPKYEGMPRMRNTNNEMGKISNLITDMTIQGAPLSEIERAVKHSMVVIDAEKHYLNYKQSYEDNKIGELKAKYQTGGASTIISQSKGELTINERKKNYKPNPETGEWEYKDTGRTYIDKNGKEKLATESVTKMSYVKDAYELTYGGSKETAYKVETYYADYANQCKALANQCRKDAMAIETEKRNPSAVKTYAAEVESLDSKLTRAEMNSPRERQARIYASNKVKMMLAANPELKLKENKKEYKKVVQYCLAEGRNKYSANKGKVQVEITTKEWEAIQAGAISSTKLDKILKNTDMDKVREYATPRTYVTLSDSKQSRIKSLSSSGKTAAEIAEIIGCSTSTVYNYL